MNLSQIARELGSIQENVIARMIMEDSASVDQIAAAKNVHGTVLQRLAELPHNRDIVIKLGLEAADRMSESSDEDDVSGESNDGAKTNDGAMEIVDDPHYTYRKKYPDVPGDEFEELVGMGGWNGWQGTKEFDVLMPALQRGETFATHASKDDWAWKSFYESLDDGYVSDIDGIDEDEDSERGKDFMLCCQNDELAEEFRMADNSTGWPESADMDMGDAEDAENLTAAAGASMTVPAWRAVKENAIERLDATCDEIDEEYGAKNMLIRCLEDAVERVEILAGQLDNDPRANNTLAESRATVEAWKDDLCEGDPPADDELHRRTGQLRSAECTMLTDLNYSGEEVKKYVRERDQLREIREEQSRTDAIIPTQVFEDLCREIAQEYRTDLAWEPEAFAMLQAVAEEHITKLFDRSNAIAIHTGRTHIQPSDIQLVQHIRGPG